jgi:hypothetical protein
VLPNGKSTYELKMNFKGVQYRAYLYATLYGNPAQYSLPSTPIPRVLARRLAIIERQAEIRQRQKARQQKILQSSHAHPALLAGRRVRLAGR